MSSFYPKRITQLSPLVSAKDDDVLLILEESEGAYLNKRILNSNIRKYFQGSKIDNSATTSVLSTNSSEDVIFLLVGKTYSLTKVITNVPARVVLYIDSSSRSNDSTRPESTDPLINSGVILDIATGVGDLVKVITPAVIGWNTDSNIYAKVVNKGSSSAAVTVTLTYLSMES